MAGARRARPARGDEGGGAADPARGGGLQARSRLDPELLRRESRRSGTLESTLKRFLLNQALRLTQFEHRCAIRGPARRVLLSVFTMEALIDLTGDDAQDDDDAAVSRLRSFTGCSAGAARAALATNGGDADAAAAALASVGLGDLAPELDAVDDWSARLSLGEQQRAAARSSVPRSPRDRFSLRRSPRQKSDPRLASPLHRIVAASPRRALITAAPRRAWSPAGASRSRARCCDGRASCSSTRRRRRSTSRRRRPSTRGSARRCPSSCLWRTGRRSRRSTRKFWSGARAGSGSCGSLLRVSDVCPTLRYRRREYARARRVPAYPNSSPGLESPHACHGDTKPRHFHKHLTSSRPDRASRRRPRAATAPSPPSRRDSCPCRRRRT